MYFTDPIWEYNSEKKEIEAEKLCTNLKWPHLDVEEETDSGEQLETLNQPYPTVMGIEEPMGLKEIMESHKKLSSQQLMR